MLSVKQGVRPSLVFTDLTKFCFGNPSFVCFVKCWTTRAQGCVDMDRKRCRYGQSQNEGDVIVKWNAMCQNMESDQNFVEISHRRNLVKKERFT